MVVSWRDVFKFLVFVVLAVAVVFYVAANREHLLDSLSGSAAGQPDSAQTGSGQPGTAQTGTDADQAAAGSGQTAASSDQSASAGGQIVSVGAFGDDALTALGSSAGATGTTGSTGSDLFVEFRLEREKARSQQLDLLREVIDNPNVGAAERSQATTLWLEITENVGAEVDLESLIRAKGFADAVAVLDNDKATVMVKAASLTQAEVLRIADLAVRVTGLGFEDITVMARGG